MKNGKYIVENYGTATAHFPDFGGSVWPGYRYASSDSTRVIENTRTVEKCRYCGVKPNKSYGTCEHCGAPL